MVQKSTIRLVCFDLGGVLIRICRSWSEACAAAGIELRGACVNGVPDVPWWDELAAQFNTGRIDGAHWASQISLRFGGLYTAREIFNIHDAYLLAQYEGVDEIVARLHGCGVQTTALSNTNHDHWVRMGEFPVVGQLHHRLASHELGLAKPDPAMYRELERRLNRRGNEILFFDDLPPNIAAAHALGWNTELIDPHGRTDMQMESALIRHGVFAQRDSANGVKPQPAPPVPAHRTS